MIRTVACFASAWPLCLGGQLLGLWASWSSNLEENVVLKEGGGSRGALGSWLLGIRRVQRGRLLVGGQLIEGEGSAHMGFNGSC